MVEINLPPSAEAVPATPPSVVNTDPPSGDPPTEPSETTPPTETPAVEPETTPTPSQEQVAPVAPPKEPTVTDPPKADAATQLYARTKNAEDKVKEYREQFGELPQKKGSPVPKTVDSTDPIEVAKVVSALRDYSPAELDELAIRAKGLGVSPVEAAETDGFKLFVKASREQVVSDKGVSSPDASPTAEMGKTSEEIGKMSKTEFAKYEKDYKVKVQVKGI